MTKTQHIRRGVGQLQRVKTWQLLLLLLLAGLIAATFLRLNNIGMIERRTAVINADKAKDKEILRARLFDLQRYSTEHMNADTGVVYLAEQYQRDTQEVIEAASARDSKNNINVKADQVCKERFGGYSQAYVQCFASELAKYPSGINAPDKANLPNPNLYRHEFFSPEWSPDFAGFSLLVCLVLTVVILARLFGYLLLRALVHRHYSSV